MVVVTVRKTGEFIDGVVASLLESLCDKEVEVRDVATSSLVDIGTKYPHLVLSLCNFYLFKNEKLDNQEHRLSMLNVIEKVSRNMLDVVSDDVAFEIISQSFIELTSKEEEFQYQLVAIEVISVLHHKFCDAVMNELLEKFQPGILPSCMVVKLLAKLALSNVSGTVPYLKACLKTCLTLFDIIKTDSMKYAFSEMVDNFCKAIVEYTSNSDISPDQGITKDYFHEELGSVWDFLCKTWLNSKNIQLKCVVIGCLGNMSYIVPHKLQEFLQWFMPSLSALYKKQLEAYVLSEALHHFIEASELEDISLIEPFVDYIIKLVFQQACSPVDLSSSSSVKNYNEILKIFLLLARFYPDRIVNFILNKLESPNEATRIACLNVINHLINYAGDIIKDKETHIIFTLKLVTLDPNIKVKRKLSEVIFGVAHCGYLELEGGQTLIEFIVKQCLLPPDPVEKNKIRRLDNEHVSNDSLRLFCENVIYHVSTSIPSATKVLWPYLLTLLATEFYTDACGILCKSIAAIACRKLDQDSSYYIDFEKEAEVPRPSAIFVRLIVLLRYPSKGFKRGPHILDALIYLSKIIKSFDPVWGDNFAQAHQQVTSAIAGSCESVASDAIWEENLLKLLQNCLEEKDDWPALCGEDLTGQLSLYSNYPDEKKFLFLCIGMICCKSKKNFVIRAIDLLFKSTQHAKESEREACAKAVGLASSSHPELVINKLNEMNVSLKMPFIITFFKEVMGDVDEKMKATLILSYGYFTIHAPSNFLKDQIDSTIMAIVKQNILQTKDIATQISILTTVKLIGDAASKYKESSVISLSCLNSLIGLIKNLMKQESQTSLTNSSRSFILKALIALTNSVSIEPTDDTSEMFSLMVSRVVCLPPSSIISDNPNCPAKEQQNYSHLLLSCLGDLEIYACLLLNKNTTPEMFAIIFKVLKPSIVSAHDFQRIRSLQIFEKVVQILQSQINILLVKELPSFGYIVATIVPRCLDPSVRVRFLALDCIEKFLILELQYKGKLARSEEKIERISTLRRNIEKTDSITMFASISDLSKLLNENLSGDHIFSYLEGLIEGLTDLQQHCSSAAGLALANCIKTRGSELYAMVEKIFFSVIQKIPEIKYPQTKTNSLRAVRYLVNHNLAKGVNILLEEPVPFSSVVNEVWKELGQDSNILPSIMDYLLDIISRSPPYEETVETKGKERPTRRALASTLAITSALTELMKSEKCHVILYQKYPQILVLMLVQVASMTSVRNPHFVTKRVVFNEGENVSNSSYCINPVHVALNGLKQLLTSCKNESLMDSLTENDVWNLLALDQMLNLSEGLTILACYLMQHQSDQLPRVINLLSQTISSSYPPQRIMATAMFAEFIKRRCNDDFIMADMIMKRLIERLQDSDSMVRQLCIRGLGNISNCGQVMVQKYSNSLLSAMIGSLDEIDDDLSLEAIKGLLGVLNQLKECDVQNVLISVALRIRPYFEKEVAEVRAHSLKLFGFLASFGLSENKDSFLEQIYSNFVSIVLHCGDSSSNVQEASKGTLKSISPLLESKKVNEVIQRYDCGELSDYTEFLKILSKAIAVDMPEKMNYFLMVNQSYLKSSCSMIRGNSATFAGCMLGCFTDDRAISISKIQHCQALTKLLKDDSVQVRMRSAEAMRFL